MRRIGAGGMAALALAACGSDAAPAGERQVRDSAGVEIVTLPDIELPAWRVDSAPFLDIGALDGDESQTLQLAWASRRLADGRIAVSHASTNELRFYDETGRMVAAEGGAGEGPGEFGLIAAVHRGPGDTLVVADASQPRLSLFSPAGEFVRNVPVEPVEGRMPRLRGLQRGRIPVYRIPYYGRSGGVSRAIRDTAEVRARPLDGDQSVSLGRFLAREMFHHIQPNGAVAAWPLPFSRDFHTAFAGGLTWVGVSDRYELRGYDASSGELRRVVRVARDPVPVDATHRQRFFDDQMAGAEDEAGEAMYREIQAIITFPTHLPTFAEMLGDTEGRIWVRDYQPPWDDGESVWRVYSSEGDALASVRLPGGLEVHDIGAGYVLGNRKDELEVEHIQAFRLTREGGP